MEHFAKSKKKRGKLLIIMLLKTCHITWVKLVYYDLISLADAYEKIFKIQLLWTICEPLLGEGKHMKE